MHHDPSGPQAGDTLADRLDDSGGLGNRARGEALHRLLVYGALSGLPTPYPGLHPGIPHPLTN